MLFITLFRFVVCTHRWHTHRANYVHIGGTHTGQIMYTLLAHARGKFGWGSLVTHTHWANYVHIGGTRFLVPSDLYFARFLSFLVPSDLYFARFLSCLVLSGVYFARFLSFLVSSDLYFARFLPLLVPSDLYFAP